MAVWQNIKHWLQAHRRDFLIAALLIVGGFAAYFPSLGGGFVYDDHSLVERNYAIRSISPGNILRLLTQPINDTYRPLRAFSYALDYQLWGLNPLGFHLTNILLHVLNGILVYWLVCFLLGSRWCAAVAALLFTLHPIQTEAVAWISGRKDLLATAFVLSSFLLYLHTRCEFAPSSWSPQRLRGREIAGMVLSMLLFAGALLVKEHAVAMVGVVFLYEILSRPREEPYRIHNCLVATLPYLGIGIVFVAIYLWIGRGHGVIMTYHQGSMWGTVTLMTKGFAYYIALLLMPVRLCADYNTFGAGGADLIWAISAITLAVVGLGIVWVIRRMPSETGIKRDTLAILLFGVGWFIFMLMPVSNIVPIAARIAERYLYLPSVGLCVLIAALLFRIRSMILHSPFTIHLLILLVLACFGVLSFERSKVWTSDRRLWENCLRIYPDAPRVNYSVGYLFHQRIIILPQDARKAPGATPILLRATFHYQKALRTDPHYAKAIVGLAQAEVDKGNLPAAMEHLKRALAIQPRDALIHACYASVLSKARLWDEAVKEYLIATKLAPNDPEILRDLGRACLASGHAEAAFSIFQRTMRLCPTTPGLFSDLGNACLALGRFAEAAPLLEKALAESPDDPRIAYNLAYAYRQLGDTQKAKALEERLSPLNFFSQEQR